MWVVLNRFWWDEYFINMFIMIIWLLGWKLNYIYIKGLLLVGFFFLFGVGKMWGSLWRNRSFKWFIFVLFFKEILSCWLEYLVEGLFFLLSDFYYGWLVGIVFIGRVFICLYFLGVVFFFYVNMFLELVWIDFCIYFKKFIFNFGSLFKGGIDRYRDKKEY